jgi:hypothetical protein
LQWRFLKFQNHFQKKKPIHLLTKLDAHLEVFVQILPNLIEKELTDCDAENSETQTWLEFAYACKYINENIFNELTEKNKEVGKLINYMLLNPAKFGVKTEH